MPWIPADVERRLFGEDRDPDPGPDAPRGELLVWIPAQLAPRSIRALESVADLVEQRHGTTPMVELVRLVASSIREAVAR